MDEKSSISFPNKNKFLKKYSYIVLLFVQTNIYAQNIDINILKGVNVHRNQSLDGTMKTITASYIPVAAGFPSLMVAGGLISHNKKLTYDGLELYASVITNWLSTQVIKAIVNRKRPAETYTYIEPYKNLRGHSFPSGHTSTAFAFATTVSLEYKKWYVVVPAYTWASLVGYSRMHLGVHYPSDVLGGMIIGAGSSYLCFSLRKLIEANYRKKKESKQLH